MNCEGCLIEWSRNTRMDNQVTKVYHHGYHLFLFDRMWGQAIHLREY